MANWHSVVVSGILIMATFTGCRSERGAPALEEDASGGPPVPVQVDAPGPGVESCTEDLLPALMGEIGYQVVRSEASPAGCVVVLEALADPDAVSAHFASTMGREGYASTDDVAAKGGRRLTYAGTNGLAISILMRGTGRVALQDPEAESHLELHWYNPALL